MYMSEISKEIGQRPDLKWVDVDLIDVDRNYQRMIKPQLVKKIMAGFRWDYFGAVVLARSEAGRYHVTDGQHRVRAACLHSHISQIPALVVAATGVENEAANFLVINRDRQAVNSIERYWAGITARDETCLHTAMVLKGAGCDVVPEQGAVGVSLTSAVFAVQRAIKRFGDDAVTGALLTICEAWPKDIHALRGVLITTLARLINNNKTLDQDRLVELMRAQSFVALTAHAEGFRKLSGGSAETALSKTIVELYNRGLSKNTIQIGMSK